MIHATAYNYANGSDQTKCLPTMAHEDATETTYKPGAGTLRIPQGGPSY